MTLDLYMHTCYYVQINDNDDDDDDDDDEENILLKLDLEQSNEVSVPLPSYRCCVWSSLVSILKLLLLNMK